MRTLLAVLAVLLPLTAHAAGKPGIERRIYPQRVEADSDHVEVLVDGDESASLHLGGGALISMRFQPLQRVTRLRLRVLFTEVPRRGTIDLYSEGGAAQLKVEPGWQTVDITSRGTVLQSLQLDLRSLPRKQDAPSIAEIEILATSTAAQDPAGEKRRLEALRRVRDARQQFGTTSALAGPFEEEEGGEQVAGYFEEQNMWRLCRGKAPCQLRQFVRALGKQGTLGGGDLEAVAQVAAGLAGWAPVALEVADPRPFEASGFMVVDPGEVLFGAEFSAHLPLMDQQGMLKAGQLRLAPAEQPSFADALAGRPRVCRTDQGATWAWALRDGERLRAIALVDCRMFDSREGYNKVVGLQVLTYDREGRLELTVTPRAATRFTWKGDKVVAARSVRADGFVSALHLATK